MHFFPYVSILIALSEFQTYALDSILKTLEHLGHCLSCGPVLDILQKILETVGTGFPKPRRVSGQKGLIGTLSSKGSSKLLTSRWS